MIALVLAPLIALAVAPPPPKPDCGAPQTALTSQHGPPTHAQKLGDLPDADMDLAVIRSVDGCWVREVTRFKVSQRPAGVWMAVPTPGFRGKLVREGPVSGDLTPTTAR